MVQQSVDMPVAQVLSLNTGDPEMKEKSHDQTRHNHCKFDLFPVVQVVFWGTIQDCRLFPNIKRKEARASLGWSDVGPMGPSGKRSPEKFRCSKTLVFWIFWKAISIFEYVMLYDITYNLC